MFDPIAQAEPLQRRLKLRGLAKAVRGVVWSWRDSLASVQLAGLLASAAVNPEAVTRVLGTDRDLDGLAAFPSQPVVSWQWSQEEKKQAAQFSRVEIVRDSTGAMLWTLKISPNIPFKRPYLEILSLGIKYFPPEADALRMKVKTVTGKMTFSFGGPTAYFGNSDAFLRPICVEARPDGPEWRTVEFSLHDGLLRNFRRASFSEKAPWIYYARWTQEPTYFYVFKGSGGEIQIKDLEIVTHGFAKPFPVFGAEDVIHVATLTDFSSPDAADRIFSALVGDKDQEFDASWKQANPVLHPPPDIGLETDKESGNVLHAKGKFLEETSAVGMALANLQDGDGLQFRIKVTTEATNVMIPTVECQPVDFLLYESPAPTNFDWRMFSASPELVKGLRKGYDRNLTYHKLNGETGLSTAIFHARRFVTKGQWSEITIPFADFLCIYGRGELSDCFQQQLPPNPRELIAAAVLVPWSRQGRADSVIDLRDISLVNFRHEPNSRRSYFQFPDATNLKRVKSKKGGFSLMLAPGEAELPPDLRQLLEQLE